MRYIVIEGNIGAGKTTLSKMFAKHFNAKLILEHFADNPFLPKFYKEPNVYSFQLELSFLADRYQQLNRELTSHDLFKKYTIADYYFMKSLIFAQATLKEDEYNLYRKIFNIIYQSVPNPDIYVYLHMDVDKLMENIKRRGRDYEQYITKDYLYLIQKGYFEFFKQNRELSFLVLDINEMDFVLNADDYKILTDIIFERKYEKGITRLIPKG